MNDVDLAGSEGRLSPDGHAQPGVVLLLLIIMIIINIVDEINLSQLMSYYVHETVLQ